MDVGARIRQARESRGLSREAVARVTRIPLAAVAAIERNDIAHLPPYPYNKGFVEAYAREVALEPHATAFDFLDQFEMLPAPAVAEHQRIPPDIIIEGRPRRIGWLAVPLLGLLFFMLSDRGVRPGDAALDDTSPSVEAEAAAASVRDEPTPTVARDPVVADAAARSAASAAHAGAIAVVLSTTGASWVEAHADGHRVLYELLEPGADRRISADRGIALRVGDASAVSLMLNGQPTGALGSPGQVRVVRITRDGVQ